MGHPAVISMSKQRRLQQQQQEAHTGRPGRALVAPPPKWNNSALHPRERDEQPHAGLPGGLQSLVSVRMKCPMMGHPAAISL
jgi:hypothetical protein